MGNVKKLPVDDFKWVENTISINKYFTENHIPEIDVQYHEKLHDFHNGLPFSPIRMKN